MSGRDECMELQQLVGGVAVRWRH